MLRVSVEVLANGERHEIAAVAIQRVRVADDGVATYAAMTSGDGSTNAPLGGLVTHRPEAGALELLKTALIEATRSDHTTLPPTLRRQLEDVVILKADRAVNWWKDLDDNLAALDCSDEERTQLGQETAALCLMGSREARSELSR